MARTRSAMKADRVAARRRVFNTRRKKIMKDAIKRVKKLIATKDAKGVAALLSALYKAMDKAAKSGTIKKNTAARIKSRIVKRVQALSQ